MADDISKVVAAGNTNGRRVVGAAKRADFVNASGAPEKGFLRGRNNAVADVDITGGAGNKGRAATNANVDGAAHTIKATKPAVPQEAQATQANGRVISPSHRGGKNFWSQA